MVSRRRFLIGSALALAGGGALVEILERPFSNGRSLPGAPSTAIGDLTTDPLGGWTWIQNPRAVTYGGYLYFGLVTLANDHISMAVAPDDHISPAGAEILLHSGVAEDEHNAPTFLVRSSDHKLIVFYQVGQGAGVGITRRISVNSLDSDPLITGGFGSERSMPGKVSGQNYANPIELTGEAGSPIYLFIRDNALNPASRGTWRWLRSTNQGETWTNLGALCQSSTLSNWGYMTATPNGTKRVDFQFVNGYPGTSTNAGTKASVYHFYMEGGAFFKSDGTSAGSPLMHESNMTLVYDGSTNGAWLGNIEIDGSGNPIMCFPTYPSSTDHRYNYAACDGPGIWTVNEIVAAGTHMATVSGPGGIQTGYPAGLALNPADPNIFVGSVENRSGGWDLQKFVTADGGASFTMTPITTGSTVKNIRPVFPRGCSATGGPIWTQGAWGDYTSYTVHVAQQS